MITLIAILANTIFNWEFLGHINNILLYVVILLTVYSGLDYLVKGWKKVIK
jgi:phosphatidylglycerophosphate synthase